MNDLEIEVTKEDIEKAIIHCPVERALLRLFPKAEVHVGYETATVDLLEEAEPRLWYLDETLMEFVQEYDDAPPYPLPARGQLLVNPPSLDYVGPDIPGGDAP